MGDYWEEFWEWCYRQRHGHPSRGDRADLERQAAFVDETIVNATADTDMNLIQILVDGLTDAITEQQRRNGAARRAFRVQTELFAFDRRIFQLRRIAREAGVDLNHIVLEQTLRASRQATFHTSHGTAIGNIPTVRDFTARIFRAIKILFQRYLQQCESSVRRCRSPGFSDASSDTLNDQETPFRHDPGQALDSSLFNFIPGFGETPPYLTSDQHFRNRPLRAVRDSGQHFQAATDAEEITFFPDFEPARHTNSPPLQEYKSQSEQIVSQNHRRYQGFTHRSSSSDTPTYRSGREGTFSQSFRPFEDDDKTRCVRTLTCANSLLSKFETGGDLESNSSKNSLPYSWPDLEVSTYFTPRLSYAQALKSDPKLREIRNICETAHRKELTPCPVRTRPSTEGTRSRQTNFHVNVSPPILSSLSHEIVNPETILSREFPATAHTPLHSSFNYPQVSGREDSSAESADTPASVRSLEAIGALQALEQDNCLQSSLSEAIGQRNAPLIGIFGSGIESAAYLDHVHIYKYKHDAADQENYQATQKHEQKMLEIARDCWLPSAEVGIFGSDIDSPEYLACAHSCKIKEDTADSRYYRMMQRHERETHQIAAECWLPPNSHRRLPNAFTTLSIQGDCSLHAYAELLSSSRDDASEADFNEREHAHAHLRGGSYFPLTDSDCLRDHYSYSPCGLPFAHRFINSRGNEYFCDIDEDYMTDRFNLTSLNTEVQYYQYALDLITDVLDIDVDDETREQIEKSARHLYGLVHARYIVTTRGLQKMCEKYKKGDFGKCPRVACDGQPLLPMGQHDSANQSAVKLYCGRCEDLYNPKSSRHSSVDGAYFGSSFHNMFFQVYPNLIPPKSQRRYEPKIFGFKVHAPATLARWQSSKLEEVKETLRSEGLETGFEEEEREEEMEGSEDEDDVGQDGIDDMFEGRRVAY